MATKTMLSMAEFLALPDDAAGARLELSEGELTVSPPPRLLHTVIVANLTYELSTHVRAKRLGRVLPSEAGYLLGGQTFRCPDVSFVRAERLANVSPDGWMEGAPDLAVEVISPSETAKDIKQKLRQFLDAGSSEVWLIYPEEREAEVYTCEGRFRTLKADDSLECPTVLPGFSVRLGDLFA